MAAKTSHLKIASMPKIANYAITRRNRSQKYAITPENVCINSHKYLNIGFVIVYSTYI